MTKRFRSTRLLAVCWLIASAAFAAAQPTTEAGPANGGLRLRLTVKSVPANSQGDAVYQVGLDLINATTRTLNLTADWPYEGNQGDYGAWLEAATGFETYPAIAPWVGQVLGPNRTSPQPTQILAGGGQINLSWWAGERRLKREDYPNPLDVANPRFPFDGLYAVHAVVRLRVDEAEVLLRSNEQLVPVGGSVKMPRATYGAINWVDEKNRVTALNLGSLQGVRKEDRFILRTGMSQYWLLTPERVEPTFTPGKLTPCDLHGNQADGSNFKLPQTGTSALLLAEDTVVRSAPAIDR